MKWIELLQGLDEARSAIRREVDLRSEVVPDHAIVCEFRRLTEQAEQSRPRTKLVELPVDERGEVIYPNAHAAQVKPSETAPLRGARESGGMKIEPLPREPKGERKPPRVEEATEETVGKD